MASDPLGESQQLALFAGGRIPQRSRRQTERALQAMRALGRLEPINVGQVAMLRTIAQLIDAELVSAERSSWTVARLVTEWRALWAELAGRAESGLYETIRAFFTEADDAPGAPAP